MENLFEDKEYYALIKDILDDNNFKKLDNIEHHGTTRLEHSLRVSYYSYLASKKFKLHTKEIARAGLLHDFFMSYEDRTKRERFFSTFIHPRYAAANANKYFNISDLEYDIIRTHMFPLNLAVPKYSESWIVSIIDKVIGFYEFFNSYKFKLSYATNYLYFFIFLNFLKLR